MRIGQGYDVHRTMKGYPLYLGGIRIPHTHGLQAHSDGDVLIHAICDSLLGAASLRDIGYHFPPDHDDYSKIDSKILLKHVMKLITSKDYTIGNIDSTLCLEKPKLKSYIPAIVDSLSKVMNVDKDIISVKATTNERLGYIGNEEAISAMAISYLICK